MLQYGLFISLGNDSSFFYSLTTAFATIVTTVINFFIQRKFIFKSSGRFHRYIVADLFNLVMITLLAPLFRLVVADVVSPLWGDRGGFVIAAFIASIPTFLIKRSWVFREHETAG